MDVIAEWNKMFDWKNIAILGGNPAVYQDEAQAYQSAFEEAGLSSTVSTVVESDWSGIQASFNNADSNKDRVFLLLGNESFIRKVVCASLEAKAGITWITVGSFQRDWWTVNDPDLIALAPQCTGG